MKCTEFDNLMDEYYENDLSCKVKRDVDSHLEICNVCKVKYEKYVLMVENLKILPDKIQPTYNLWPTIREKIDKNDKMPERLFLKFNYISAVAAIFIFIFFSVSMFYLIGSKKNTEDIDIVMKEFNTVSKEYLKIKEELLRSLVLKESVLSSETIYEIESNIKLIDNAIDEIKLAIKSDPSNSRLVFNLADTYSKETALLLKTKELIVNIKE